MKYLFLSKIVALKSSIRKKTLQNLVIICGSIALSFLVAEGIVRILYHEESNVHKGLAQGFFCKRDPLLGWIGQPYFSGTEAYDAEDMDDLEVTMNNEGFWDIRHNITKPPGIKRLLFLGDSFTIGYGIPKEARFSDMIKDRLSSNYEVINMGMWGYSTDQELLVLTEKGLKYAPDVVIISLFLDDLFCCNLFSVNNGMYIKPRFSLSSNGGLKLHNVPVPDNHGASALLNIVLSRFFELRNLLEMGTEFHRLGWFSVFDKSYLEQNRFYLSLRLLDEIYSALKTHHIRFLVVLIPSKEQLYERQMNKQGDGYFGIPPDRLDLTLPQRLVSLFCQNMGIPVLDLLPVFKRHDSPEKFFFKNDCHWTKAGHRVAAEQILAHLQKLNYL